MVASNASNDLPSTPKRPQPWPPLQKLPYYVSHDGRMYHPLLWIDGGGREDYDNSFFAGGSLVCKDLLHGALATATLAASISSHWIVCKNPMGRMVYGHSRQIGQLLTQYKSKHSIFYTTN